MLAERDLSAPLAWRAGVAISGHRFLRDAQQLAARLPATGPMVNLCIDRYQFAVGLAAALMRGQTSLLPPNALPATLMALVAPGHSGYALTDDLALVAPGLPLLHLPGSHEPFAALNPPQTSTPPTPGIASALLAACLLTSGSTGAPQPHAKTWGSLGRNIDAAARRLADILGWPSLAGLTLVATVPPQHSYGFESSVMLALLGGAAFDSGRPYFPADIAQALARVPRPRALVTTPFHLKTLLQAGVPLPAVDLLLSATAPLSPQLALQAEQAFGAPMIEIYGCTEAGQVATRRTVSTEVWHCFDGLSVHQVASASAGPGGLGNVDADAEPTTQFAVEGGHVGDATALADLLHLQDAQHFRLLGRANDLIHVAGKRSSLAHLNYHLNSIEGVLDGAFWLPDGLPDGVVRTVAVVVAPGLSAAQLIAALRTRIEAAFVPRRIVHCQTLPREATGKLTVQALRALAQGQP